MNPEFIENAYDIKRQEISIWDSVFCVISHGTASPKLYGAVDNRSTRAFVFYNVVLINS